MKGYHSVLIMCYSPNVCGTGGKKKNSLTEEVIVVREVKQHLDYMQTVACSN